MSNTPNPVYEKLMKCYESFRSQINFQPEVALILGSGLGDFANDIRVTATLDYHDIEGFPVSTVPGHAGRFIFGYVGDVPVVCMQGRVHYYEGYPMTDVVLPTRLMKLMGAKALFLTNAAGGIKQGTKPGSLMLLNGQIACFVPSPLIGPNIDELGTRFPDMSQIYDLDLQDIVKRAATYAEDLKAFVDNIEIDLFLPKLASNLAQEINNILHIKEQLQKENTGAYPLETLKDVTNKIITYLKDLSLCSESVDEEQVVSHIVAIQNSTNKEDPFGYLDEAEVTALTNLVKRTGSNQFIALDRQRQELEIQLSTLDNLRSQKQTLEQTQAGGNEYLIQNYEASQNQIEKLKGQEATLKADIQRLEKRIHQFDVQIQQEPDIKFDTLVKLKPLFEKIADSLLKKKKPRLKVKCSSNLTSYLFHTKVM